MKGINNSLKKSSATFNRELNRMTQRTIELNFEATANFVALNPHPMSTCSQNKHRIFPIRFLAAYDH